MNENEGSIVVVFTPLTAIMKDKVNQLAILDVMTNGYYRLKYTGLETHRASHTKWLAYQRTESVPILRSFFFAKRLVKS